MRRSKSVEASKLPYRHQFARQNEHGRGEHEFGNFDDDDNARVGDYLLIWRAKNMDRNDASQCGMRHSFFERMRPRGDWNAPMKCLVSTGCSPHCKESSARHTHPNASFFFFSDLKARSGPLRIGAGAARLVPSHGSSQNFAVSLGQGIPRVPHTQRRKEILARPRLPDPVLVLRRSARRKRATFADGSRAVGVL